MKFKELWTAAFGLSGAFMNIVSPALSYSAEATVKKVSVGYVSFSPSALWFLLEKEIGYFREEGLSPEFVLIRGGSLAVKGLMAGNLDYVSNSAGAALDAIIRGGQPLKVLLTTSLSHFWLVAQPDIHSIADLKGKKIGISSFGGDTDLALREIFKRHNLDPFKDATLLVIGASRERFAALSSGAVHATLISPPFNLKAAEMGYRTLAKTSDYVKWPQGGLTTTQDQTLRDPLEVSRMVRAGLKGLKIVMTQREFVLSRMMQMFRVRREEAIQSYEDLQEGFVSQGYLADEAERAVISLVKQGAKIAEDIPVERVFDDRFVKQAERELKGWRPQIPK